MSSSNAPPPEGEFQLIARRMAESRAAKREHDRRRLTLPSVRHLTISSPPLEERQQEEEASADSDTDESVLTVVPTTPLRRGYHVEIGFALVVASELPLVMGQAFCLRLHGFRVPRVYKLFYQATKPPPGNIESGCEINIDQTARGENVQWTEGLLEFWIKPVEVGMWYFGLEVEDYHLSTDRTWWMCTDNPVQVVGADNEL